MVVGDEAVGDFEDAGGAAEVFFEADDYGVGPVAFEVEDVADVGAAPAVDGLVGVACGADIVVGGGEGLCDSILGVVGVLIFVDEQEFETIAEFGADVGMIFEQKGGLHQQVIEIEGVEVVEDLLIAGIDF